ncbi:MAG: hypothetical protein LVQ95_00830 [Candidatus Micrarchaeales archaeon]|nr:hypothetical protein [Candidatus Micrarchaeales archaeon]
MGADIKAYGRTYHIDDSTVGRFISTRIVDREELAKMRGVVKSGIKTLLEGKRLLDDSETKLLADYALACIENEFLERYILRLSMKDKGRAEETAVENSEILERLREAASAVQKEQNRGKMPELLLYIIKHDYGLFR